MGRRMQPSLVREVLEEVADVVEEEEVEELVTLVDIVEEDVKEVDVLLFPSCFCSGQV